jgi:superfamily II DNA or RNA helicase
VLQQALSWLADSERRVNPGDASIIEAESGGTSRPLTGVGFSSGGPVSEDRRSSEPLFVVDNSEGGRDGLGYLRDWCEVANAFDIATGYFEVGALVALDKAWQKLDKIRILMGDEVSRGTRQTILEAVKGRAEAVLDRGLESDKHENPFLEGVEAVVEALHSHRIECRVYNRKKFHAKTYITHAKLDVIGSQALVGSSNFTRPGLTQNVELNIKLESSSEVAQLQEWYERHWNDAEDVSEDVLRTVERHTAAFTPFDVYARALHEMFDKVEPSANEWEQSESEMFPVLDRYQQEAYWAMLNIARQHGGALLCDGVGLGKTFVGLMLIERLIRYEKKNVVLFAPKPAKESVWQPELRRYLSHVGGGADFSNLTVLSHTDLTRGGEFPERFRRVTELADAVVIDEAHHFRNPGKVPDWNDRETWTRYYALYNLIGDNPKKPVYMLTATPINNSLDDFRHLVELFTRRDDRYFARTLGVNSVIARIKQITRSLRERVTVDEEVPVAELITDAYELLAGDPLFDGLVVQRSRAYARKSQLQQTGNAAMFPERADPTVAAYSVRKTYGKLLDMMKAAFEKDKPLFALSIYYPLAYYCGNDADIDPIEQNRQAQVVALIRTNFLKRFESSVYAFERSCDRLLRKLLAFVQKNAETPQEERRLQRWIDQRAELLMQTRYRQLELWGDEVPDEAEEEEDVVPPELLEAAEKLSRDEYDVREILQETYLDLDQLAAFLDESRRFQSEHDDKLKRLVTLLRSKDLAERKVLVFTEFADTARYLRRHLQEAGIDHVVQIDSGTKVDRAEVLRRFSPYYNGSTSRELAEAGLDEIRVLVSTDVLSEGLNLQDATRLVNYDIHWNPVRLMQRIGRVDRRLSPSVEAQMKLDHPESAADRGKVKFWNFLPPDELDELLRLYRTVSHKALLISKTLGIEGRKLLSPEDDFEALKEFNAAYEGETTVTEELHLEYQRLLLDHPGLEERLASFPSAIFSGRLRPEAAPIGAFFCFRLPALDTERDEFTLEAGITRWYLAPLGEDQVIENAAEIATFVRSNEKTPRVTVLDRVALIDARDRVLKHVRNGYLKQVAAPVDAPGARLVCWMELNGS